MSSDPKPTEDAEVSEESSAPEAHADERPEQEARSESDPADGTVADEGESSPSRSTMDATPSLDPGRVPRVGISARTTNRLTLGFVSLVFVVTFVAWGGAKLECNLHPPRYEEFKPAPLSRLASTPKDGALEFQHRLRTLNFDGARELALNDGLALVEQAEQACDQACKKQKADREDNALTRAVLLKREGRTAVARVETHYQGKVDTETYTMEWKDRMWKVVGVEP